MTLRRLSLLAVILVITAAFFAVSAAAQDAVTVGTVSISGSTADVPVYIRDIAGTPLGRDAAPGSRIQSLSLKVDYAPASAVSSVTFTRAGITTSLTPTAEFAPSSTGSISLLTTFQESTNLIPFTLNAAPPGNQVAHLVFNLSPSAAPGTSITLALDPSATQLTDQGGTSATAEKASNGTLTLVNGVINIAALTVVLSPSPQTADLHSISTTMTATISAAVGTPTNVALTSSNTGIATVPASVTISAGTTSAAFALDPLAIGQTTITATLPPGAGGGSFQATFNVVGPSIRFAPLTQVVPLGGSAPLTLTLSTEQPTDTTVALSTTDSTVATVTTSVVIPAGQKNAIVQVNGIKVGAATLQATLPQSLGGGTTSASLDISSVCLTPAAPSISAPSESPSGTPYDITWPAVSGATEYVVDEAADAAFTSPTTRTVSAPKATYTHIVSADTRYYYRVRAHNSGGAACDKTSPSSASISVQVKASSGPLMRILPVVGSLPGAFGSFFRTSVQLYNPRSVTISGKIVFHPANAGGAAGDPSLVYALAPGKGITYADLLPAMSQSGLGSADIVAELNSTLPVSSVRVFNDGGANGTSGLSEEAVRPEDALVTGDSGVLIAPADAKVARLNIGIRTLDQGAALTITLRDKDGLTVKSVDRSYGPTFFTQPGASALLDGLALAGGETLTFTVNSGSVIIYGSATDNTTNDPALQLVRRY